MSLFRKLKLNILCFNWQILFILVLIVSGLSSFVVQMIATGLPLYCIDINKTTAEAGVLAGFYSAAVIISRPFVGKWCDEKGKYKIALIGIIMFVTSVACSCFYSLFPFFKVFQAIEGLGFSALSTALAALLIDLLPANLIIRCIGIFTVIKSLTISLGASFAVSFAEKFGIKNIFVCSLVISIVSLLCLFPLKKIKKAEKQDDVLFNNNNEFKGIDKYIEKDIIPICLLQFIFTFSLTLATCYLPSYAQTIGLAGIGVYYTISAIVMLLSRTVFSKVFEMINEKISFIVGILLAIVTTIAVILFKDLSAFIIISILNAIGISLINPTLNVKATANVDANRRGVASSTYYGALDLGSGAGSMIWGLVIPVIDYKVSFIIATVLLIFNLLLGLYIFKKKVK